MDLIEFSNALSERITDALDFDANVTLSVVRKNNGVEKQALTIREPELNIAPTIYLEEFFEEYKNGDDLDSIAGYIINFYLSNRVTEDFDIDQFLDYENVKDRIVLKLVNSEGNALLLKDAPTEDFLDLKICYCIYLDMNEFGKGSVLVKNDFLKRWKVDAKEISQRARINTINLLEPTCTLLSKTVSDIRNHVSKADQIYGIDKDVFSMDDTYFNMPVYVISNKYNMFGAAAIVFDEILKDLSEVLEDDLVIVPSSINEVIAGPKGFLEIGFDDFSELITDVNGTLSPEEILSDHPYYYSRTLGRVCMNVF